MSGNVSYIRNAIIIGLTIKYTKADYKLVIKDKIAVISGNVFHIAVPILVFILVSLVLPYFEDIYI
ncbi:MAG: hypothetical protein CMP47_09175 [Rickettsiales bacterium]|jgi:hypothetical protein|nr:hypothetical protein [Rickettsiales bacterium]